MKGSSYSCPECGVKYFCCPGCNKKIKLIDLVDIFHIGTCGKCGETDEPCPERIRTNGLWAKTLFSNQYSCIRKK